MSQNRHRRARRLGAERRRVEISERRGPKPAPEPHPDDRPPPQTFGRPGHRRRAA